LFQCSIWAIIDVSCARRTRGMNFSIRTILLERPYESKFTFDLLLSTNQFPFRQCAQMALEEVFKVLEAGQAEVAVSDRFF
jgi:hypothetical protein